MKKILLLALIPVTLFVASCGYSTSSLLPAKYNSIYVERFSNEINYTSEEKKNLYLPLLEKDVREAIIDRYLFDGNLRITESETATLILQGQLLDYQRTDLRLTDDEDVEEHRITIIVSLKMIDGMTGDVVWEEPRFAGTATYFLTGPRATSEDSAVDEAIEDLSRRAIERTVENW